MPHLALSTCLLESLTRVWVKMNAQSPPPTQESPSWQSRSKQIRGGLPSAGSLDSCHWREWRRSTWQRRASRGSHDVSCCYWQHHMKSLLLWSLCVLSGHAVVASAWNMLIDLSTACAGVVWCVSSSGQKQRQQAAHSALASRRLTATLRPFGLDGLSPLFLRTVLQDRSPPSRPQISTGSWDCIRLRCMLITRAHSPTCFTWSNLDRICLGLVNLALRTADCWRTPFESSFARKSDGWSADCCQLLLHLLKVQSTCTHRSWCKQEVLDTKIQLNRSERTAHSLAKWAAWQRLDAKLPNGSWAFVWFACACDHMHG